MQPLSDRNFQKGFNRIYDHNLARSLNRIYKKHHHLFDEAARKGDKRTSFSLFCCSTNSIQFFPFTLSTSTKPKKHQKLIAAFDADLALNAKTIREFDDAITRVAFDWPTVDDYYQGSSSADVVHQVTVPLLVIQAADDPIAPKEAIPFKALEVGFIGFFFVVVL